MSGEVKLGEADYTVFWETLLFMSNILCQISWKGPFDLQPFQGFLLLENAKNVGHKCYFYEYDKTRDLC